MSAQQLNIKTNRMPTIEIDYLPSITRYLQKSQTHFKIEEAKYCSITQNNTTLKIFAENEYAVITQNISDTKNTKQFKFKIDSIPKRHHRLYFFLLKIVKKLRERTIKYTIVRTRELDKADSDKVSLYVYVSGTYTIHWQSTGSVARLNTKDSDIKFTANNKTQTIPFTYRNNKSVLFRDDAHDTMRSMVHELIGCAESVEKQKLKRLGYAKTWKIKWNADSGSVEDIKESILSDKDKRRNKKYPTQPEGLFKCNFQSDTTVSSDYSDTNSEIPCGKRQEQKEGNKNEDDKSLSMVEASFNSTKDDKAHFSGSFNSNYSIKSEASWRKGAHRSNDNSIKSEASWGPQLKPYNNNSTVSSIAGYQSDKEVHLQDLTAWDKREVCSWLESNKYSSAVIEIFWSHDIDGKALIKLSSNAILQMFSRTNVVTNQEKKQLILSISNLQKNGTPF